MLHKIWLISSREYLTRVQKRTFLIMTFASPLLFAAMFMIPVLLMTTGTEKKVIEVLDDNGVFLQKIKGGKTLTFQAAKTKNFEKAKQAQKSSGTYALLYLPKMNYDKPEGIQLISEKNMPVEIEEQINRAVAEVIETIKLEKAGIDRQTLEKLKTDVSVSTRKASGEETNSIVALILGFGTAFLIYLSVFIYGSQVMLGVIEEKSSRVIEVIISSVKPFELMMGKILGVAGVGLTQFILWIGLTFAIITGVSAFIGGEKMAQQQMEARLEMSGGKNEEVKKQIKKQQEKASDWISVVQNLPLMKIIFCFLFYFAGGYLMYSSLFAATASAVENQTDAQQFIAPITIPLVVAFLIGQVAVTRDPDGAVAFWASIFPLTSPIVMMVRLPFEVPMWQLLLSMALLVLGFIGTTWLAARIYRVGILMYGKKPTLRELGKWIFYKN